MNAIYKIGTFSLALILSACGGENVSEETVTNTNEPTSVFLTEDQIKMVGVETEKMKMAVVSPTVETHGTLELPPENKAQVSTILGGRIKSIKIHQGQTVKKGQVLAELESTEFLNLQEDYLLKNNELVLLKSEYEREEKLNADQISSTKNFQKAKSAYDEKLIQVKMIASKLEMLHVNLDRLEQGDILSAIPVVSPVSGTVDKIDFNLGQFVHPGDCLLEVINNDHMHVQLIVYEKDMSDVKVGQSVVFSTASLPDQQFEGVIFSIGQTVQSESNGMLIHAELDNNTGGLKSGMYLNAKILLDSTEALTIPRSAVFEEEGKHYVFRMVDAQNEEYEFIKSEVIVEKEMGEKMVVSFADTKLTDQTIVTKGVIYILGELYKEEE